MIRFIMPAILIGISITVFFVFANPIYSEISTMKTEVGSYEEALTNSKALEDERDKLTAKYNAINPDDLIKIKKLLPENADNIRLILEIEQIAKPYGMVLKDVKYSAIKKNVGPDAVEEVPLEEGGVVKDYGIWDLEFSTTGTYDNFINFTKELENNLRIVDISSIKFSSDSVTTSGGTPSENYKYDFKIKTYWLKN